MEAASGGASPEASPAESPPAAIVCEQCGMKFRRVQDLGKHRNKHKIDEEVEKLQKERTGERAGEDIAAQQISEEVAQAKVLEEAHERKQADADKAAQTSDEVVQEIVPEQANKTEQAEEEIPLQTRAEEVERDSSWRREGPIGTCLFCMKFTRLQLAVDRSSIGRRLSRSISKSMRLRRKQRQLAMAQWRAGRSGNVVGNTDEAFNLNKVEGAGTKWARIQREQHQLSAAQHDAGYSSNVYLAFKASDLAGASADAGYGRNKHRSDEEAITTKSMRMQREQPRLAATWSGTGVAFDLNNVANIISDRTDPGYDVSRHGIDREHARTKKRAVAEELDERNEELDLTLRL